MLSLANASIGYGSIPLISCVELTIEPGEAIFLSGANGSGKSTLAKTLIGVQRLMHGSRTCAFKKLAYVPQSSHFDVQYPVTVRGLIRQGLSARYRVGKIFLRESADESHAISKVIDKLRLKELGSALIREISGGQLQRALIGRALIGDPDFLLLDEPFSNLDRSGREEIASTLRSYFTGLNAICVIDHGDAIERGFYTRFLEIDKGHIFERDQ